MYIREDRPRFVEATEHGQSKGSMPAEVVRRHPSCLLLVQPCEELPDRSRAEETSRDATHLAVVDQSSPLSMSEGLFTRVPPRIHLGSHGRHRTERRISDVQSEIVTRCLEHRQRALEELSQALRRALRLEVVVEPPLQNAAAELAHAIANGSCSLGDRVAR